MNTTINNKKPILAASLFLTFTVCMYAPMSIYISNRHDFWFNLRMIWYIPTVFFLVAFVILAGIGLLLKDVIYSLYLGVVFGAGICFYIQGNFLSIKIGIMNGNYVDWAAYFTRMWIDAAVWVAILAVAVGVSVKRTNFHKVFMYIAVLLCLMQIVSLSVLFGGMLMQKDTVSATRPTLTTQGICEVGSDENVIVFIVDAFDEKYFDHVRDEVPSLMDEFDGFTRYDNFTSIYPTTNYSLTGMMSDRIFRNESSMQDFADEASKDHSYFDELSENGYEISIYTTEIASIPHRIKEITTNYAEVPMRFYNLRTCFSLLYRLTACQYFPDIVKPYVWMDGTEILSTGYIDGDYYPFDMEHGHENGTFKEGLEKKGLSVKDGAKEYKFIHIRGTHEPYYTDEWGDQSEESWDYRPTAIGCVRILCEYLQELKDNGVYDCSSIIITADHGASCYPGLLSNPVFLIKRQNEHHPIETCHYEASLMNLGSTVADLAGGEYSADDEHISVLDLTEDTKYNRYYFAYIWDGHGNRIDTEDGKCSLVEYLTAEDTNDTSKFVLTDSEYTPDGERIPHKENCKTCSEWDGVFEDYYGWNCMEHVHKK